MNNKYLLLAPFIMASAHADTPWTNEVEMGFLLNRGNNYNTHFDSRFTNKYENHAWLNKFSVASILDVSKDFDTNEKVRSAEKYSAVDNLKYKFTKKDYVYTEVDMVKDQFSAFDYEISESIGYGRKLIDSGQVNWYLEGGPGGRHSRATRVDGSRIHNDELVAHASTHFSYGLTNNSEFTQDISYDLGKNVRKTRTTSAVKAKVWDKVSLKLSYMVEYNAILPDTGTNNEHTDTTTTLTAAYVF